MAQKGLSLVFTGQGSQKVGMLRDLLNKWPSHVLPVLEEAESAINCNLKKLMLEGPQEELTKTSIAQPAILTHSYAVLQILKREMNFDVKNCKYAMGHSLGQFSALVATESLDFFDGVKVVHCRGKAMMESLEGCDGRGAMAALFPVTAEIAQDICARVSVVTGGLVCQVANYNSSKQVVISGHTRAVNTAIEIAQEFNVRRALLLDVSAPFHSDLMQSAADKLAHVLEHTTFRAPVIPVVCNVTSNVLSIDTIKQQLHKHVVAPVRWSQSVDFCLKNNASIFLELGYGRVLTNLITQHSKTATCVSLGTSDEVERFLQHSA